MAMNNTVFWDVMLLAVEVEKACSPRNVCKFLPYYVATARNMLGKTAEAWYGQYLATFAIIGCIVLFAINLLKPNDIYICRTAALTSRRYILNIYSTNIHTEYFKHVA